MEVILLAEKALTINAYLARERAKNSHLIHRDPLPSVLARFCNKLNDARDDQAF